MITIKNTQRKFLIDTVRLERQTRLLLSYLKYRDFDVGIWITTNRTLQKYNKMYRGKNKPTDILSFPFHPYLKAGDPIVPASEDEKNLGDLIISAERVMHDAQDLEVSFEQRLKRLLVHGITHLLGYDHVTDEDYRHMNRVEESLLQYLCASDPEKK